MLDAMPDMTRTEVPNRVCLQPRTMPSILDYNVATAATGSQNTAIAI